MLRSLQLRNHKSGVAWVIGLALLAVALSFAKFDHCRNAGWSGPGVYIHACYSDLPALYESRNLTSHSWPYSSATNSVEYPPVTGLVMWATTYVVGGSANDLRYFDINSLYIAILFIASAFLLFRLRPEYWYLLPLSPAVVASLYINWDIWAVILALTSIYLFDEKRYEWSAVTLAISIATKFFPIVLLIPIAIIFLRRHQIHKLLRFSLVTSITWLAINLPFALTTPTGWWRFFQLNSTRGADWGSLWYLLQRWGVPMGAINSYSILLFLAGGCAFVALLLNKREVPTLSSSSFLIVAAFTLASKVYSPQYIIWLTPLAILALRERRRELHLYWIWQGAELIYHVAIWEFLAVQSGARYGAPDWLYEGAIALRILTLGAFVWRLSTREIDPQKEEFPSLAKGSYA